MPGAAARETAGVALLALRHLNSSGTGITGYSFNDSPDEVPETEATRILAELPKPILCHGRMSGSTLHVQWRALRSDERAAQAARIAHLAPVISKALPGFSGDESTPILLVVGADSMIVSAATVQRWWADYSFGSQEVGQSFDKAGRAEAKRGVEYIWHLHTQPLKGAIRAAKRS